MFSDFLNLFFFDTKEQLAVVVKALSDKGLFQSLAEPNLVAESGKEASFLAGGEFPIPIAQGSGANIGVSVMFKEFGIRLNFTPTVNGDRVHLKVRPEVSALDFNNSIVLSGFRIPSLTTRRTETELELNNGQTFAIAGLMNNTMLSSMQKIPGLGDIPILGLLFRSKAAQKNLTELVVMITPEILPNNSRGVTPNLPRAPERFLDPLPERRTQPMPPPPFAAMPVPTPAPVAAVPGAAGQDQSAQSAAAAVSGLTPSAPRVANTTGAAPANAATATPVAVAPPRQLTEQEQKDAEKRARAEAQAYARAQAVEGKRIAEERVKQDKVAKEQAKRDAEASKKQAAIDRERQKQIDEAAARLKAAEAAYQSEVARQNKP